MSSSKGSSRSLGPLSVGNVVSAAIRIYRDRFSVYYKQALIAYLWLIVPFYGWAKFFAISGLLSRLAYQEAFESPETVSEARRNINPRLCIFLETPILINLIMAAVFIPVGIITIILPFSIAAIDPSNLNSVFSIVISLLVFLFIFSIYIWIFSRLSLSEVPIAVDNHNSPVTAISRSWELTKSSVGRIMLIFSIAFVITIPITVISQTLIDFLQQRLPEGILILNLISWPVNALTLPFWQLIKGVTYYDLRSRQEGIDLELGNS